MSWKAALRKLLPRGRTAVPGRTALMLAGAALVAAGPAVAAGRVALVIGNTAYAKGALPASAAGETSAFAELLRAGGFDVVEAADLDRRGIADALNRFYRTLDKADLALFYFAGQGVQLEGRNYILPVDAKLEGRYDFEFEAVDLDEIVAFMQAHARRRVVLVDASRPRVGGDGPFVIGDGRQASVTRRGLAARKPSDGTVFISAAEPDTERADAAAAPTLAGALRTELQRAAGDFPKALTQMTSSAPGPETVRPAVFRPAGSDLFPIFERRELKDFKPVHRIVAQLGKPLTDIDLPIPETAAGVDVLFERMPPAGEIMLGDKVLWPGDRFTGDRADDLAFRQKEKLDPVVLEARYRVEGLMSDPATGVLQIELTADAGRLRTASAERDETTRKAAAAVDGFRSGGKAEAVVELPVGVGPRPIAPPAWAGLASRAPASTARLEITKLPEAGRVEVDGEAVGAIGKVDLGRAERLAFAPPVGSEGKEFRVEVAAVGGDRRAPAAIRVKPVIAACDREAGDRLDRQGVWQGLLPTAIRPQTASRACRDDIERYGALPRFVYQLGRAQLAARDRDAGLQSITKAADAGHARARYLLGYLTLVGAGGAPDPEGAVRHYRQAHALGDVYATYSLGKALYYGRGVAKDPAEGLRLMLAAADAGHTFAMNELGSIFRAGDGVAKDVERARRWFERGVAADDVYSMRNLALMYMDGEGVAQDYGKARDLMARAANGGHPSALNDLGRMEQFGWGGPKRPKQAAVYYAAAAKAGDGWGASNHAWFLLQGTAGKPDPAAAARYWGLAAGLQATGRNPVTQEALNGLAKVGPEAKRRAIAALLGEIDPALKAKFDKAPDRPAAILADLEAVDVPGAGEMDRLLIAASRSLWLRQNPRLDLF